ncbi:uncharacterized protein PV07_12186 [Cladophialophora immunda]|uniref:UEV domain-containing protein n=2 Tax=Cladophialophora immunda TaxID=569365 RepID=A0A0D2CFD7_9EURO|nr:uncharacterized protein PV07_12186 [Cladophialophora immunda]KIW22284.1 hypothetical protein PV07_12186 [Cladophialophora immunda]
MAGVPQKTLNWLYDVLKREYRDPNRTYSDLAHVLTRNPGFAPRTDVYTFENGAPALLLQFKGTIPVSFRGSTYRFPIVLWIPHAYPYEAPMCYVTPTEEMMIRPGQHVGGDGRIYHPYLAHWREHWERSNILDFMSILSDIFAKEPPVMSRSPVQQQRPAQPQPPPVPPLPREMQPPPSSNPPPPVQHPGAPAPPPPPPKQPTQTGVPIPAPTSPGFPTASSRPGRYDAPPPLPSQAQVPGQRSQQPYGNGSIQRPASGTNFVPQRSSSLRQSISPQPPYQQHQHPQAAYEPVPSSYAPPPPPPGQPGPPQQYPPAQPHPAMSSSPGQGPGQVSDRARPLPSEQYGHVPTASSPLPYGQPPGRPISQQYPANYAQQPPQQPYPPPQQQYQPPPQPPAPKPAPTPNLLDSPFDIPLPAPNPQSSHHIPAPPIPVNPEKEALLTHLSHLLTTSLHQQISQNNSALAPLASQYAAMQSTTSTLNGELSNLKALHATISSNISLLQSSLSKADQAISSAHARAAKNDIPHVDEMLTAPTVVARQLYDAACEERGIEAAILALQEGFVRGRVGSEVWAKRTRELAREEFKRRWMVSKVGRGMGLDLEAGAYGR